MQITAQVGTGGVVLPVGRRKGESQFTGGTGEFGGGGVALWP